MPTTAESNLAAAWTPLREGKGLAQDHTARDFHQLGTPQAFSQQEGRVLGHSPQLVLPEWLQRTLSLRAVDTGDAVSECRAGDTELGLRGLRSFLKEQGMMGCEHLFMMGRSELSEASGRTEVPGQASESVAVSEGEKGLGSSTPGPRGPGWGLTQVGRGVGAGCPVSQASEAGGRGAVPLPPGAQRN